MMNTSIEDIRFQEQTRLLIHNSRTAAIVNISIALLTYLAIPSQSHAWLWLILGIAAIRCVFSLWFCHSPNRHVDLKKSFFLTLILVAMQGATWGIASIILYNSASDFHRFYLIAIICGMTAGSVLSLTPSLLAFSCFTLPTVLPLVSLFLIQSDQTFRHAGFMGVVFLIAVHILAKRICDSNSELIDSRTRLEMNSKELEQHKNHLEVLVEERTKELAHSRETYRRLTEEINDAIYELDAEGRITYISPAITSITGYQPEKLTNCYFTDFIAPDDLPMLQEKFPKVLSGILEPSEFRIIDSAGNLRWLRASSRPILSNDGPGGLRGILTDIEKEKRIDIERRKAEEEKAKLESVKRQLQKTESLGRMAGAIAHHFNNKLHVVMGHLELATYSLPPGEPSIANLNSAMEAAGKAAEVGKMMLTYLGQVTEERRLLDLSETCGQCLPLIKVAMPKNLVLETDLQLPGPVINANANQIQQILTNLITNAWEAAGNREGAIRLTVRTASPADIPALHRFPINWQPADVPYACLEVRDKGCGIADKDLEEIFSPFFSTKFTGRGLGLSVVLGLVQSHGGVVTVESSPGQGSVLRVFFPMSAEEIPEMPLAEVKASEIEETGTVLLVDDDRIVLEITATMLSNLGFTVLKAMDGIEGVELFQKHKDDIRFVLCDVAMPRMNGWQTLTALRLMVPGVAVILTSGYSEEQVMEGASSERPQAFLGKPYGFQALRDTIRSVLKDTKKI